MIVTVVIVMLALVMFRVMSASMIVVVVLGLSDLWKREQADGCHRGGTQFSVNGIGSCFHKMLGRRPGLLEQVFQSSADLVEVAADLKSFETIDAFARCICTVCRKAGGSVNAMLRQTGETMLDVFQ